MCRLTLPLLLVFFFCVQCTNNDPSSVSLLPITYSNLNADAGITRNTQGKALGTTGHFRFFSFRYGQIVANTDSLTTKWDVGFRGTTIIVNGGPQRKGSGGAIVLSTSFNDLQNAPQDGYDLDSLVANKPTYAIPDAVNEGWYAFNVFYSAIPNKVLVIRTADNRFVKMEILNFYKNSPPSPNIQVDFDRYYTFRYVFQTNGSRNFN